jgi:hypothetical protein
MDFIDSLLFEVEDKLGINEGGADVDGSRLGISDGLDEGDADVDGVVLGLTDGFDDGAVEGDSLRLTLGSSDGDSLGEELGMALGTELGEVVVVWASAWRVNTAKSIPATEIFMSSVVCCLSTSFVL